MQLRFNNEINKHSIVCEKMYISSLVFIKGDVNNAILNLKWQCKEGGEIAKCKSQIFLNGFKDIQTPSLDGTLLLRKDDANGYHKFPRLIGGVNLSFQNSPNENDSKEFDVVIEFSIFY